MASAGRPDWIKACTCRLVASEQLPETTACCPTAGGKALAVLEGARPKLPGKPIATPEPAVTSGMPLRAGARRIRSSLEIASTTARRTPWLRSWAMRAWMAAPPCATTR